MPPASAVQVQGHVVETQRSGMYFMGGGLVHFMRPNSGVHNVQVLVAGGMPDTGNEATNLQV